MGETLLLATKNAGKVRELHAMLDGIAGAEIVSSAQFLDLDDPEETGTTFLENARLKARYYSSRTGLLTLADDSGLVVDALGGRPGVYSSRYGANDPERIARLLAEMNGVGAGRRTARFVCAMSLYAPSGEIAHTEGILEGEIAHAPEGTEGFGYDPVFHVPQLGCRLAEIPRDRKNEISHRARALQQILPAIIAALTGRPS